MIRPMVPAACLASALMLLALVPMTKAMTSQQRAMITAPVLLIADQIKLDAPETVDPGAQVAVTISGGQSGGRIELWGPVTQSGKGGQIDSAAEAAGSAMLVAPEVPGTYELRYVNAANKLLAKLTLDVAALPITLSAAHGLGAGIDTPVEWRGPANPGDMIQIYDPAGGAVISEVPAEGRPGVINVAVLRGPEALGDYQIRYWSGTRQAVLRSLPVTVGAGDAWLRTPIEVFVGETFMVEWQGPSDADHLYQIVDPETDTVVTSQTGSGSGSARLMAPSAPGAYRVQLVNIATGSVLADLPLDVDPK